MVKKVIKKKVVQKFLVGSKQVTFAQLMELHEKKVLSMDEVRGAFNLMPVAGAVSSGYNNQNYQRPL